MSDTTMYADAERIAREMYHHIGGPPSDLTPAWESMPAGFRTNRVLFVLAGMTGGPSESGPYTWWRTVKDVDEAHARKAQEEQP